MTKKIIKKAKAEVTPFKAKKSAKKLIVGECSEKHLQSLLDKESGPSRLGRPTDYKVEYNELAKNYCLLGATDVELAKFFDVSEVTLNSWKKEHPEFLKSIKAGKEDADGNVANRLYQRAMGFEHDSEDIRIIGDKVARVKVRKVYAPDTAAAIFWLKNRQKDKWRDKIETEHSGEVGLNKMTDEQIEALLTEKLKGKV